MTAILVLFLGATVCGNVAQVVLSIPPGDNDWIVSIASFAVIAVGSVLWTNYKESKDMQEYVSACPEVCVSPSTGLTSSLKKSRRSFSASVRRSVHFVVS
ncbi:hypothetical protein DIPPA_05349 [Diplonema papillatum]|nr:hypothetical protein DIPPA_05349 [Diplonema papillatum]